MRVGRRSLYLEHLAPSRVPSFRSLLCIAALAIGIAGHAQPCLVAYNFTQSPPPVNGTYGCGETVTFCFTVTNWNSTNANWFHGIAASFGPGWDLSTLTPGPPPASCSGTGTWAWYPSVQGTAGTNIGPQGPGFFYNYSVPADGNPGNNFGDFCVGAVNWQFCWTISVLSGPACLNGLGLGVTFNTFGDSETGGWSGAGCGGDAVVPSSPAVIQACPANAGSNGSLSACSSGAAQSLFSALGGSPQAGGAWTGPSGAAHSGSLDPSVDASGAYVYTVTSAAPVCSASATVTVTIAQQPDAGADATTTVCAGDAPFGLTSALGGTPAPGGSWSGPAGAFAGLFSPATDASGVYTYTVNGTAPCPNASASVTVTVNPSPSAGSDGALTLCSSDAPVDLVTALGGSPDPGGAWTSPSGTTVTGLFSPGIDAAGAYTYAVPGTPPCPTSSATVAVTVNALPNAGSDATAVLCETAGLTDLLGLLGGSPDASGQWTDPTGAAIGGSALPSALVDGDYQYTATGAVPCPNAVATLSLTVSDQPDAGSDASVTLCEASAPLDLLSALAGAPDAGGDWTGPGGAAVSGTFSPGSSTPGVYIYTLSASPPCTTAQAILTITVNPEPYAGIDGTVAVCSEDAAVDLLAALGAGAQPGGTWTDPVGAPTSGSFSPGSSVDGTYTYTIPAAAPCPAASATVSITTTPASDPGTDGVLSICSSDAAIALIDYLGGAPQAGGTWTGPGGWGVAGTLDPAIEASGVYSYTLPSNGPCPAATAAVTVTIAQAVSSGLDGSLTVCSSAGAPASLFNALGGSPTAGGAWSAPDGSPHGPTFAAAADQPGIYTYSVQGIAPCPAASSTVDVAVTPAPSAGTGGSVTLCADEPPVDPFSWLGGSPEAGGSWTGPDGPVAVPIDPPTAAAGAYTYTVPGTAPCPSAQAVIQLTVDQLPQAGVDGILNICADGPSTNLLGLLSGAQAGGTWAGPAGTASGTFSPGSDIPGTYTYLLYGTGACAGAFDQATVAVTVHPLPLPSFSVAEGAGCAPQQAEFTNTTAGSLLSAAWAFGDGAAGNSTAVAYHTYTGAGAYDVALTVTDANGCVGSTTMEGAVLVSAGPEASFYALPPRVSIESPTVTVFHAADSLALYSWTIDDLVLDTSGTFQWTFSAEVGERVICLTATDTLGCANSECLRVLVDDNLTIHVPNAFTPNADEINEVFRPSIIGVQEDWYEFMVFDRWGQLVFRTTDPAQGWDGSYLNGGQELPTGVYVWTLKAKDQFTPDKADLIGSVTLLR